MVDDYPWITLDDESNLELFNAFEELTKLNLELVDKPHVSAIFPSFVVAMSCMMAFFNDGCGGKIRIKAEVNELILKATAMHIHRTFMTGAHIYFEECLASWCRARGVAVTSRRAEKLELLKAKLTGKMESKDMRELAKLVDKRPNTIDLLDAAFRSVPNLRDSLRWRKFLDDFAIIRNVGSHADPTLTDHQQKSLRGGSSPHWSMGQEYESVSRSIHCWYAG